MAAQVEALGDGWHPLPSTPGGPALDYVRGNLFDPVAMRPLPPDVSGPDNDLADLLDHYMSRAIGDATARLSIFGQRWGPEAQTKDKVFGFLPGNGVHDVHMNQGNVGRFRDDDGVYQDGGLLLHLPGESRWVAIFLAFQSQAWHTDDQTGHALSEVPPPASDAVPPGSLPAGATVTVPLADGVQLGNQGGTISLLDAQGIKVTGVAYTKEQARQEGWTVTF